MLRRMLSRAVRAVEVDRGGRRRAAAWTVIADVDPEPSGLGASEPRRQHRDRRVVAMDLLGGEDLAPDSLDDRLQQPGCLADPVA